MAIIAICSNNSTPSMINKAVGKFWNKTLRDCHPGGVAKFNDIKPDEWHSEFLSKISVAGSPPAIFRHIGQSLNLTYKKTADITDDEKEKFFTQVRLPRRNPGNFKNHVFDMAINEVLRVWDELFVDIENNTPEDSKAYIKNWNLDSGADEEDKYFW